MQRSASSGLLNVTYALPVGALPSRPPLAYAPPRLTLTWGAGTAMPAVRWCLPSCRPPAAALRARIAALAACLAAVSAPNTRLHNLAEPSQVAGALEELRVGRRVMSGVAGKTLSDWGPV